MSNLQQDEGSQLQQHKSSEIKGRNETNDSRDNKQSVQQSKVHETRSLERRRGSKKRSISSKGSSRANSFSCKNDFNWKEMVSDLVMVANTCAGINNNNRLKKKTSIQWRDDLNTVRISANEADAELQHLGSDFVLVQNSNPNLQTVGIVDYKPSRRSPTPISTPEKHHPIQASKPEQTHAFNSVDIKKGSIYDIGGKKSQMRFTESELAYKSQHRVEEVLGFQAASRSNEPASKVQSLTLVKEKPSSELAAIVHVSENIISVSAGQQIQVATSRDDKYERWEVEPGFSIFKSLNPVAYSPSHIQIAPQSSNISYDRRLMELHERERFDSLCGKTSKCMEFLNTIEFSHLFITNTIEQARESHVHNVWQYGEPNKRPSRIIPLPKIATRFWSTIKSLTKEEGIFLIERYIVNFNHFKEDWKYTIFFEGIQDDQASDHYFYVANFSLPTKLYPIAQVTVSLYFKMEVSRIVPPQSPIKVRFTIEGSSHRINPDKFILNDEVLCRVLDTKIKIFQECTI